MLDFLFSIVVPVYNVEKYLQECVTSLIRQTFKNYEIILVDDGSTDTSGQLCDQFARENFGVSVIHQKNQGLSAARNTGIRAAKGKYLLFVDSDDYISNNTLENFYHVIEKNSEPDIVAAYAYVLKENGETAPKFPRRKLAAEVLPGNVFLETALQQRAIVACAPFNAYKRELIVNNNLFYKIIILHEDEWWTPQIFFAADRVAEASFTFYYHRIRVGSITRSLAPKRKNSLDIVSICRELEDKFDRKYKGQARWTKNHLAELYMSAVFLGDLCHQSATEVDRWFPLRNAASKKCWAKAMLFAISPKLYCCLDKIDKS